MADLVPTASPFEVKDSIAIDGRSATVAGRSQRDWGMGPWDEFFVAFDDGTTAWLAGAQGNWYLTSRVDPTGTTLHTWEQSAVGMSGIRLGSDPRPWMINEKRQSTLIAAKGEFDAALAVGELSHYLDLSAPGGGFATADFGDNIEAASLYIGRILPGDAVKLVSSALGPRPEQRVDVSRLQCPHCGAPIPLFAPSESQRAICGSCGATLNTNQGKLELLGILDRRNLAMPAIALGSKGTLRGTEYIVIGYMRRYTIVEGDRYDWGEYLLYGSGGGYTWLVEDNSAFMLTRTIQNADVQQGTFGDGVVYEGTRFRRFFDNQAYVDMVVGEFYWKVEIGETVRACDYIAPPRVVSIEYNPSEIISSLSEHLPRAEVEKAFSVNLHGDGVPVASPNPYKFGIPAAIFGAGLVVMIILSVIYGSRFPDTPVFRDIALNVDSKGTAPYVDGSGVAFGVPGDSPAANDPNRAVTYTDAFTVRRGPTTIEVTLATTSTNVWVGADCALINEDNGEVIEFTVDTGEYRGYTGGENWSEGQRSTTDYISRVHSGHYSIRCVTDWETYVGAGSSPPAPLPPSASLSVVVNGRGPGAWLLAFLLLILPFGIGIYLRLQHEKKRWENSNVV
ncbi:MAG: DUF4178 domain-containing protein [Sandaracinaceae bacterium]|nr:DUF4178 domain-containing protein [Sandaracinaceae bacterium]